MSKDQKTTEFRQNWIDSIREEIAQVVATIGFILVQVKRFDGKEDGNDKYIESCSEQFHEMSAHYHRIQLRLNPKGKIEIKILALLTDLEHTLYSGDIEPEEIYKKSDELIALSQSFLKKEWLTVKRGEIAFVITKYSFLAAFLSIIAFALAIFTGSLEISTLLAYIKA